jgi:crotonobetaine/carnitine-CoA ligase
LSFLQVGGIDVDRTLSGMLEEASERGVQPGTRLTVLMWNSLACVQTWFAANWVGAAWAPVNTEWRGQTLANAVRLAAPTLVLVDDELHDALLEAFDGQVPAPVHRVPAVDGVASVAGLMTSERVPTPVATSSLDTAALLYTSGTTGRSKACILSHRYFVGQAAIAVRDFGLRSDDVLYCPFPLFHADATALTTVPALLTGATAALSRRFSARKFWDEIRATDATVFDFMGATISILYKADPRPDDRQHRVRLAWGVPVPDWAEDFERRFGLTVLELYGSVEVSIPVTQPFNQPRELGSCGRVTPEFEVRIADRRGDPVAASEVGELLVRESPAPSSTGTSAIPGPRPQHTPGSGSTVETWSALTGTATCSS